MADTILTREGYNKIEAELEYLRNVKRVEVSNRLHSAIEGGGDDLYRHGLSGGHRRPSAGQPVLGKTPRPLAETPVRFGLRRGVFE